MSAIARAIAVSRPQLSSSSRKVKTGQRRSDDSELVARIKSLVQKRASYGYRRVAARLNAMSPTAPAANHKRAYRVMKASGPLLPKHSGRRVRVHDGKATTLKGDLRFCRDAFEVRCANGERVHVAFATDCRDREVVPPAPTFAT